MLCVEWMAFAAFSAVCRFGPHLIASFIGAPIWLPRYSILVCMGPAEIDLVATADAGATAHIRNVPVVPEEVSRF